MTGFEANFALILADVWTSTIVKELGKWCNSATTQRAPSAIYNKSQYAKVSYDSEAYAPVILF